MGSKIWGMLVRHFCGIRTCGFSKILIILLLEGYRDGFRSAVFIDVRGLGKHTTCTNGFKTSLNFLSSQSLLTATPLRLVTPHNLYTTLSNLNLAPGAS